MLIFGIFNIKVVRVLFKKTVRFLHRCSDNVIVLSTATIIFKNFQEIKETNIDKKREILSNMGFDAIRIVHPFENVIEVNFKREQHLDNT